MLIQDNVSLSAYSTMRLGGPASYLTEVNDRNEVSQAVQWAKEHGQKIIMIGEGSNIIWRDEGFKGLVLVNRIKGFEVYQENNQNVFITVGAGEHWDSVVARTVEKGLNGLAELSLIPGTAGATPVQNVGAYGREISETLVTVEALDTKSGQFMTIPASDCGFDYRTSRFKTTDHGRFLITAITLLLSKDSSQPPFYDAVTQYFHEHNIASYTPQTIRQAVVAIRTAKLPDPAKVANNGSFFANPIVSNGRLTELVASVPELKYWRTDDGQAKLSAAWLIEQAGFKNAHDKATGMATWPNQPLVFVNEHARNTADLLAFKQKIVNAVKEKFSVELVQEPELLP